MTKEIISQKKKVTPSYQKKPTSTNKCFKCGWQFVFGHQKECPAIGKTCYNCGKQNHLSNVCFAPKVQQSAHKNVRHINNDCYEDSDSENESNTKDIFGINSINGTTKATILINNVPVKMVIDSGASINIIDQNAYNAITRTSKIVLKKSNEIFPYGIQKPLNMIGYFDATIENKHRVIFTKI